MKKYYKYDSMGAFAPNAGVPMHANQPHSSRRKDNEEIITPIPINKTQPPSSSNTQTSLFDSIFKGGKLLGKYETDDIMLLCIIFLLLQKSEDIDFPLLLALGYIFLSDKDFSIF